MTITSTQPGHVEAPAALWDSSYSVVPQSSRMTVDDAEIAVSIWEPRAEQSGPDVVLVHGGAAQRQWWDHLAPLLQGAGRVVALDLSGHGDSGHREQYTLDVWSREVVETARRCCTAAPILVGHSLGGLVSVNAAQTQPDAVAAVMALDSPLRRSAEGHVERRNKLASRPVKSFASRAEAVEGYNPFPPVPDAPAEVVRHIAQFAHRQADQRWALKYDPRIYLRPQTTAEFIRVAQVPTWWVQAERGYVDETMAGQIRTSLGPQGHLLRVPNATHNMLLDQPLATAWLVSLFVQRHSGK